jgi:hypothetical protein
MAEPGTMPRLCAGYIRHPCLIGALYGGVPTLLCFGGMLVLLPFREVYVLRLVLALVLAVVAGAGLNRYGLSLWLLKHRSSEGPAGPLDGALIGGAIGAGTELLPPLTSFIGTNHPDEAKTFIICAWLAGTVGGMLIGVILGAIGRKHVDRTAPAGGT